MKLLFIIVALLGLGMYADAQPPYKITADTVTLTSCDSSELVIKNHTQNVPGFLFNNGNGLTSFKRGLQSLGSGGYLIGADTLQIPNNAWLQGGNTFGAIGKLGTMDNYPLYLYANGNPRMFLFNTGNVAINTGVDAGYKFNVNGSANVTGLLTTQNGISDVGTIEVGTFNSFNSMLANNLTFSTLNSPANIGVTFFTFTSQTPSAASGIGYSREIEINKQVNRGAGVGGEETAIRVDFNVLSGTGNDLRAFHAASGNIIVGTGNIQVGDSTGSTSRIDVTGTNGYSQLRLRKQYTPSSSSDPNGNPGDTAVDDNYFYYKTSTGWKRVALSTF